MRELPEYFATRDVTREILAAYCDMSRAGGGVDLEVGACS